MDSSVGSQGATSNAIFGSSSKIANQLGQQPSLQQLSQLSQQPTNQQQRASRMSVSLNEFLLPDRGSAQQGKHNIKVGEALSIVSLIRSEFAAAATTTTTTTASEISLETATKIANILKKLPTFSRVVKAKGVSTLAVFLQKGILEDYQGVDSLIFDSANATPSIPKTNLLSDTSSTTTTQQLTPSHITATSTLKNKDQSPYIVLLSGIIGMDGTPKEKSSMQEQTINNNNNLNQMTSSMSKQGMITGNNNAPLRFDGSPSSTILRRNSMNNVNFNLALAASVVSGVVGSANPFDFPATQNSIELRKVNTTNYESTVAAAAANSDKSPNSITTESNPYRRRPTLLPPALKETSSQLENILFSPEEELDDQDSDNNNNNKSSKFIDQKEQMRNANHTRSKKKRTTTQVKNANNISDGNNIDGQNQQQLQAPQNNNNNNNPSPPQQLPIFEAVQSFGLSSLQSEVSSAAKRLSDWRFVSKSEYTTILRFTIADFECLLKEAGLDHESSKSARLIQQVLCKQPLFKSCNFRQMNTLAYMSKKIVYKKADILYRQNEKQKGLYFIVSGEVSIFVEAAPPSSSNSSHSETHKQLESLLISSQRTSSKKSAAEVGFISNGTFAGLEDLVLNRCRTATLQARTNAVEVIYIPLTSTDIIAYLEDEAKNEITAVSNAQVAHRQHRADIFNLTRTTATSEQQSQSQQQQQQHTYLQVHSPERTTYSQQSPSPKLNTSNSKYHKAQHVSASMTRSVQQQNQLSNSSHISASNNSIQIIGSTNRNKKQPNTNVAQQQSMSNNNNNNNNNTNTNSQSGCAGIMITATSAAVSNASESAASGTVGIDRDESVLQLKIDQFTSSQSAKRATTANSMRQSSEVASSRPTATTVVINHQHPAGKTSQQNNHSKYHMVTSQIFPNERTALSNASLNQNLVASSAEGSAAAPNVVLVSPISDVISYYNHRTTVSSAGTTGLSPTSQKNNTEEHSRQATTAGTQSSNIRVDSCASSPSRSTQNNRHNPSDVQESSHASLLLLSKAEPQYQIVVEQSNSAKTLHNHQYLLSGGNSTNDVTANPKSNFQSSVVTISNSLVTVTSDLFLQPTNFTNQYIRKSVNPSLQISPAVIGTRPMLQCSGDTKRKSPTAAAAAAAAAATTQKQAGAISGIASENEQQSASKRKFDARQFRQEDIEQFARQSISPDNDIENENHLSSILSNVRQNYMSTLSSNLANAAAASAVPNTPYSTNNIQGYSSSGVRSFKSNNSANTPNQQNKQRQKLIRLQTKGGEPIQGSSTSSTRTAVELSELKNPKKKNEVCVTLNNLRSRVLSAASRTDSTTSRAAGSTGNNSTVVEEEEEPIRSLSQQQNEEEDQDQCKPQTSKQQHPQLLLSTGKLHLSHKVIDSQNSRTSLMNTTTATASPLSNHVSGLNPSKIMNTQQLNYLTTPKQQQQQQMVQKMYSQPNQTLSQQQQRHSKRHAMMPQYYDDFQEDLHISQNSSHEAGRSKSLTKDNFYYSNNQTPSHQQQQLSKRLIKNYSFTNPTNNHHHSYSDHSTNDHQQQHLHSNGFINNRSKSNLTQTDFYASNQRPKSSSTERKSNVRQVRPMSSAQSTRSSSSGKRYSTEYGTAATNALLHISSDSNAKTGFEESDDNVYLQIDMKKELMEALNSTSSVPMYPDEQRNIFPKETFQRESDINIRIQEQRRQQLATNDDANSKVYLTNTKFAKNSLISFMLFDSYKNNKLRYYHKNRNVQIDLNSSTSSLQFSATTLKVQPSSAVKNSKRKLKSSRKDFLPQSSQNNTLVPTNPYAGNSQSTHPNYISSSEKQLLSQQACQEQQQQQQPSNLQYSSYVF